jgi:hypothetical protein
LVELTASSRVSAVDHGVSAGVFGVDQLAGRCDDLEIEIGVAIPGQGRNGRAAR